MGWTAERRSRSFAASQKRNARRWHNRSRVGQSTASLSYPRGTARRSRSSKARGSTTRSCDGRTGEGWGWGGSESVRWAIHVTEINRETSVHVTVINRETPPHSPHALVAARRSLGDFARGAAGQAPRVEARGEPSCTERGRFATCHGQNQGAAALRALTAQGVEPRVVESHLNFAKNRDWDPGLADQALEESAEALMDSPLQQ